MNMQTLRERARARERQIEGETGRGREGEEEEGRREGGREGVTCSGLVPYGQFPNTKRTLKAKRCLRRNPQIVGFFHCS